VLYNLSVNAKAESGRLHFCKISIKQWVHPLALRDSGKTFLRPAPIAM